jgi:hypothetical protein
MTTSVVRGVSLKDIPLMSVKNRARDSSDAGRNAANQTGF